MARQVITLLTDDLDGSEADRTVEFGLDGVSYTIDLSEKNAGKLRKELDLFIAAGSRIGRAAEGRAGRVTRGAAPARTDRDQNKAIRDWAAKQGYDISERGRIPASIVEAYHKH
jgi:hypothetical protein